MSLKREYGNCEHCGTALKSRQKRFCCKACVGKHNAKPIKTGICQNPACYKEFLMHSNVQKCCCRECSRLVRKEKIDKNESLDRPYTDETKHLIKTWYNNGKGNSVEEIMQILGRSKESVMKAFM